MHGTTLQSCKVCISDIERRFVLTWDKVMERLGKGRLLRLLRARRTAAFLQIAGKLSTAGHATSCLGLWKSKKSTGLYFV